MQNLAGKDTLSFPQQIFQQSAGRLALLELVFERSPGIVIVLDDQLRVREANPAAASRMGLARPDMIGRFWGEVLGCVRAVRGGGCGMTQECRDCVVRRCVEQAARRETSCQDVEAVFELSERRKLTLLLSVTPVRVGGSCLAVISATDITAQKEAEEALADKLARETLLLARLASSQRLLAEAQKLGSVARWEIDPATGMLTADEHLLRLLGVPPEGTSPEVSVQDAIARYVLPDGIAKASQDLAEVLASGSEILDRVEDVQIKSPDGTARMLRMHIQRRNTPSGAGRIVGWAQDVTALREGEKEEQSHQRLRRLFESLPGCVYTLEATPPFRVVEASPGLEHGLSDGTGGVAKPGLEWLKVVHSEDAARVADTLRSAVSSTEPYAHEYRIKAKDGSTRYVEDWGLHTTRDGRPVLEGVLFDVTEARRAERILKLQRDLAVSMSQARSLDIVFQETIRAAIEAADGDCGGIYVIEPSGWVRLVESVGLSENFVAEASAYAPGTWQASEVSLGVNMVYSQQALRERGSVALTKEAITCLVGAPAIHDGNVVAWINVGSHTRPDFPPSSRASLQVIATQFGSSFMAWTARQEAEHILQSSIDGLWVVSRTGDLLEVNDAYCRLTGWTREELIGKSAGQFLVSTDFADLLAEVILGTRTTFESPHRCKDGSIVEVEITGTYASRVRGGAVVIIIRDISARLAAEQRLRMLSRVVEQNPAGVIITDAAGRIEYVNPRFAASTGYSEQELLGSTPRKLQIRSEPQETYRPVYEAVKNATEWHGDLPVGTRSGKRVWVRASMTPLRDPQGTVTQFVAVVEDITEAKTATEALRVSQQRLTVAMEGSRDGLWDWNLEDDRVFVSDSWLAMFGHVRGAEDPAGEELSLMVHPEDAEAFRAALDACIEGKTKRLETRVRLRHKNGAYLPVLARGLASQAARGQPRHMVGTLVDLTEQERVQQQLIQARDQAESASRAKSAFLANMSHEIRTPMNAILGYAQLLLRESGMSDRQRSYVGTILRSGDHLLTLINDVLAMSQIEAGRAKLNSRAFDWWTLLDDVERMLRDKAESKRLRLEMERQPGVPRRLRSDDGKIRQIIVNLIGNAIKFTDVGLVAVRVSSRTGQDGILWHELVVTDTGLGMTPEEAKGLFRPFMQGRAAASKQGEGTGLGLAISADYARLLGGSIAVDSYPGKGSTFTFRFPAETAPVGVTSDSADSRLGTNRVLKLSIECAGTRALVADDLASNREVLVRMLEEMGFVVREAANGQEAVDIFRQFTPAVVLLDRRMPGLDGYATMRAIRGVVGGRRAKVLLVTASAMEEDRDEALALGADGFVGKPIVEGRLIAELGRVAGLKFVDHGDARVPMPLGSRRAPALSPVSRESLPPKLAGEMRHAAEAGDLDRLMAMLPGLGEGQRELQEGLRLALEQYDYDAVISWLDRKSERKS